MEQRGESVLPQYSADAVTRKLCGHAYRRMDFAVAMTRMFVTERFRAHGQPQGIDLVAVVRHARRAGRLFLLRDATLVLCHAALLAGVAGSIAAVVERDPARLGTCLRLALGGFVVGTILVYVWGWVLWRIAQVVQWGQAAPRETAAPVRAGLEAELAKLDEGNVVVYSALGPDGEQPFLGSGIDVLERVWPGIDVSRPAEDDQGRELDIKGFTAQELHAYVTERIADLAGLDGLRALNRLYVQGHHVRDLGTNLLPDPLQRPATRIDPGLVEAGVTETSEVTRTYLTLELVGTRGSYVVTVHVRARLARTRLSWEISAYYLPPVYAHLDGKPTRRLGIGEHAWTMALFTRQELLEQLLGSIRRLLQRPARRLADAVRLLWRRLMIARPHSYYDYGAGGTLRAVASDPERQGDYTQRMDAKDAIQRIQQALLRATEQFLEEHHINTSDLRDAKKTINNQTYNFSGPINGQNIFGNHGINFAAGIRQGAGAGSDDGRGADDKSASPSVASGNTAK
ncbi:hypothetical protein FCH28_14330 [Streptomyces piniterrae]|uniref:Uncharacterized protein n=1 Tax=Streptomyces piniterrae TaxID=2571125 RepID=A0A4U0NJ71_9ACTN|nr:hypothetical protein [Streptomyces piniterrae]TJZ54329.1 hypothetical protein FCH28_14330 [Streptomyces piniterrae]